MCDNVANKMSIIVYVLTMHYNGMNLDFALVSDIPKLLDICLCLRILNKLTSV